MRLSTVAMLANTAVLAVAIATVAASRGLPAGDAPDSMNIPSFVGTITGIVAGVAIVALVAAAPRRGRRWRLAAVLPILGAAVLIVVVLFTWRVVMPCRVPVGSLSPLLCLHPYWLLLPAIGGAVLSAITCAAPGALRPAAALALVIGSLLLVVGLTQVALRNEHGNLVLGAAAALPGGVLCAVGIWTIRARPTPG